MKTFKEYLKEETEDLESALKSSGPPKSTFKDAPIKHETMKKAMIHIGLSRGSVARAQKNPSRGAHYHYWMDRKGDTWEVDYHLSSAREIHRHLFNDGSPVSEGRLRKHGGMVQMSVYGGHMSISTHDGLNPVQHKTIGRLFKEGGYTSLGHSTASRYRETSSDSPTHQQELGRILRMKIGY